MLLDGHVLTHRSTCQLAILAVLTGTDMSSHPNRVVPALSLPRGHASCFASDCIFLVCRFGALSLTSSGLSSEEIQQHVHSVVRKRWCVAVWRHPCLSQPKELSSPVLAEPGA